MIILKKPEYENDDYLFRLELDNIPIGEAAVDFLKRVEPSSVEYYRAKRQAFMSQDMSPLIFERFVEGKPSLRALSELPALDSTIYTVACEKENGLYYQDLIEKVKRHLTSRPATRRCVVRLVNSFDKYFCSEILEPADVTCLSFIHYLQEGPKLVFRASDVKNELLVDILTVYEFFVKPVYNSNLKDLRLSVYSSTAQNVFSWDDFTSLLKTISVEGEA